MAYKGASKDLSKMNVVTECGGILKGMIGIDKKMLISKQILLLSKQDNFIRTTLNPM